MNKCFYAAHLVGPSLVGVLTSPFSCHSSEVQISWIFFNETCQILYMDNPLSQIWFAPTSLIYIKLNCKHIKLYCMMCLIYKHKILEKPA